MAVRILGGDDIDEAGEAFMERYGVQGYPTLMAMNADGEVVRADLLDGRMRSAEELVDAMAQAVEEDAAWTERRKALEAKDDAESRAELAAGLEARYAFDAAQALLEKALADGGGADVGARLAGLYERSGAKDKERALLTDLVAKYQDHADRTAWRLRLAVIDLPTSASSPQEAQEVFGRYVEAFESLRAEMAAAGDVPGEAAVRARLADFEMRRGNTDAGRAHAEWILEHDGDGAHATDARMMLAQLAFQVEDLARVVELLEAVLEKDPTSDAAEVARRVLPRIKEDLASRAPTDDDDGGDDDGGDEDGGDEDGGGR